MPALITEVVESLVEALQSSIDDENVTVTKDWRRRYDLSTFSGKKVCVFGRSFADEGPADRGSNYYSVTTTILVLERYIHRTLTEAPDSWIESNIEFVQNKIYIPLSDARVKLVTPHGEYWPETAEVVEACSMAYLDEHNVFLSEIEINYKTILKSPILTIGS